jgi:LPS export ABC transporter protein LptC
VENPAAAAPANNAQAVLERIIEFFGVTMPYASENRAIAVLKLSHGREFVNARKMEAENGTLTFFREEKDASGKPKTVVVNFEKALVNKDDKSALLKGKVDVVLVEGVRLTTTDVVWNPSRNLVTTDQPVTITGKDIEADGVGMEANVKDETATLKKNIKVTLKSVQSSALTLGAGPEKKKKAPTAQGPAAKKPREVLITCDGELVGTRNPFIVTFYKNVRVKS